MRLYFFIFSLLLSVGGLMAQEAPLLSNPAEDQFEFCKQLYRQANSTRDLQARRDSYQRLIPRLETYLQRFPNHGNSPAAMYYLGEAHYHSGEIKDARRVLSRVISRFRTGRYVALASNRLGYDAVSKKDYRLAASYFGKVAEMSSTPVERYRGRYQQASCYLYAGDKNKAIQHFTTIAKSQNVQSSYREGAKLKLGNLHFEKKELDKALSYFEELMVPGVGVATKNEATFHIGLISLEQGDNQTAQSCFKSVLLSDADQFKPSAQTALIRSMYKAENYKGVLKAIEVGDFPGTVEMETEKYALAGRSAFKLKNYNDAIGYFAKAERQIPMSEKAFEAAYYRLLCFYNIEGANIPEQVDAFLEVYQGKYSKHERIHKALLTKAETFFDKGRFREASAVYNRIDARRVGEGNVANLLYKRGCSLAESGDHNGSVRSFTNFLSKHRDDPRAPAVIARRGSSFLSLGDRVSALSDFDLLISEYPKDKLASLALQSSAKIKKEDKDYPEMIRRYSKLVEEFPALRNSTTANAKYWIGWGNYQLQKYDLAIPALEKSMRLERQKYAFNAGMLIVYSSYSLKDKGRLQSAIDQIRELGKAEKIPSPIYRWVGLQCFNGEEMKDAERYLTLGTTPFEPRQTPSTYWKMLGHTRVKVGKYKEALEALKNFLDVEEQPFWRAEAYYDQAVAYLGLKQLAESKAAAEEALNLRPKGKLNAEVRIVLGDIAYANKEYSAAAAFYVVVVELFADDDDLRPEALHKSHLALSKKGDADQAAHYMELLTNEFPNYLKK